MLYQVSRQQYALYSSTLRCCLPARLGVKFQPVARAVKLLVLKIEQSRALKIDNCRATMNVRVGKACDIKRSANSTHGLRVAGAND